MPPRQPADGEAAQHQWSAFWEAPWDFPAGTYRLRVEGNVYEGGEAQPQPPFYPSRPYRLLSRAFRLSPAGPLPLQNPWWIAGRLRAALRYPPARYDQDPNTPDGLRWRPPCPQQLHGTLRFYEGSPPQGDPVAVEERTVQTDQNCRLDLELNPAFRPATHSLDLSFEDPYGTRFQSVIP